MIIIYAFPEGITTSQVFVLKNECEISINIRVIIKIASIVEIALGCPSHFIFRRLLLRTVSLYFVVVVDTTVGSSAL
jgi:hypothetical protein